MICSLCPRNCGKERGVRGKELVSRWWGTLQNCAALSHSGWEEPCISGKHDRALFFQWLHLGVFCQNYKLSCECDYMGKRECKAPYRDFF